MMSYSNEILEWKALLNDCEKWDEGVEKILLILVLDMLLKIWKPWRVERYQGKQNILFDRSNKFVQEAASFIKAKKEENELSEFKIRFEDHVKDLERTFYISIWNEQAKDRHEE
jgi:hypothetical protein